jgi:hypothetical protein
MDYLPRYGVFPNQDHDETALDDGLWCVVYLPAGPVSSIGPGRSRGGRPGAGDGSLETGRGYGPRSIGNHLKKMTSAGCKGARGNPPAGQALLPRA